MKPCNLIFDGNALFHSEYSVYTIYNKTTKFHNEKDEITFIQGVANKMFYALGHLPTGGKVVFTSDAKSWRKSVEIPGTSYKASRENKEGGKGTMDKDTMDKFYKLMNEYSELLKKIGIITSRVPGAEGDDLIFKWSQYFHSLGENVIVITADRDMNQIIKMGAESDSYEPWTIQWNNNSKMNKFYVPEGWSQGWLNKPSSIFEMGVGDDRVKLKQHINDFSIQLVPVMPESVVVSKVLTGDSGDDVPPAWSFPSKTKKGDPKIVNLSDGIADKVIAAISDKYGYGYKDIIENFENEDFMTDMAGMILRIMKTVDGTDERKLVVESLRRNRTLVHLHNDIIPNNLQEAITDHIDNTMEDLRTLRQKWNRKGLFESSRFSENAAPKTSDPFAFFNVPD